MSKSSNKSGQEAAESRRRGLAIALLLLLILLLQIEPVEADSFRCGQKLVRSGDDQSELLRICGDPIRKDSAQERVGSGSNQKTVKVHRWYYKSSGRKLERVVMLHQGKIVAVRTTGR